MLVKHSAGSYPISFLSFAEAAQELQSDCRVITDRNVAQFWTLDRPTLAIEPGETSKSMASYHASLEWLANSRASRATTVVALGGGVVGDLAGFAAATYMRGIPFIQIPTSLLAQIDASVGGKVGIDLPQGKNLVGSFQAPTRVLICVETLQTLPDRDFRSGLSEAVKAAFISDAPFVTAFESEVLSRDSDKLPSIITRSIGIKKGIVEEDEFETLGLRATLNFGHTVGHAIEQVLNYRELSHGEAVAIGMSVEAMLGEMLGITEKGSAARLDGVLSKQFLPKRHPVLTRHEELLAAMGRDKKATADRLAFSLLTDVGTCKLIQDVAAQDVAAALRAC